MHSNHTAPPVRETLRERLRRDLRAINTLLADTRATDLVLEPYGESYAWLRPAPSIDEESRYTITRRGRDDLHRAIAEDNLSGPWPKVSETA